jgi:hypothetical protein
MHAYSLKDSLGGFFGSIPWKDSPEGLGWYCGVFGGQNGPINRLSFYRCIAVAGPPCPAHPFTGVNFGLYVIVCPES